MSFLGASHWGSGAAVGVAWAAHELQSKLLKGGDIGDYIGDYYGGYSGGY